jgi:hypothetical protein
MHSYYGGLLKKVDGSLVDCVDCVDNKSSIGPDLTSPVVALF